MTAILKKIYYFFTKKNNGLTINNTLIDVDIGNTNDLIDECPIDDSIPYPYCAMCNMKLNERASAVDILRTSWNKCYCIECYKIKKWQDK